MRVHLNERTTSSIGTRSEKIYDHNTEEKPNYSKRVRDELVAQFVFTLMIILANFIPTLHVAALILLFKSLTNFPRDISILPSKKPEPGTPRGFFDGRNARLRVIRPTSSDEVESQQTTSTSAGTDRTPDGRALSLHSHDQQAAAPYY